jgi:hypothetical protein
MPRLMLYGWMVHPASYTHVQASNVQVSRGSRLRSALVARGLVIGEPEDDLRPGTAVIIDVSHLDLVDESDLASVLGDAFDATATAVRSGARLIYVLDEEALYGHGSSLRAALNTGLLGGMRTAAVEGTRTGASSHAVTIDDATDPADAADAAVTLMAIPAQGQILHCGSTHLGRPST